MLVSFEKWFTTNFKLVVHVNKILSAVGKLEYYCFYRKHNLVIFGFSSRNVKVYFFFGREKVLYMYIREIH